MFIHSKDEDGQAILGYFQTLAKAEGIAVSFNYIFLDYDLQKMVLKIFDVIINDLPVPYWRVIIGITVTL